MNNWARVKEILFIDHLMIEDIDMCANVIRFFVLLKKDEVTSYIF